MSNVNGSNWIRKDLRFAIYHRDNFECQYCGCDLTKVPSQFRTLDHITPRELGGGNEATNLVTACLCCNSSKQDTPLNDREYHRVVLQASKPVDRKYGKHLAELARIVNK